ncbi:hypothetical protein SJI19_07600 [Acerihabitans sp. TG2]|uniref:hypothetical protein n=1 Tax=Acerihabitans sp. TG2 TaxID=3096008 RepID=UPI002B23C526|nr:hypothetical protein [Acerihabitans sp. TG2]MEA9390407.1 hypothetical protein [Acerihabitans sp. TG2]
MQIRFDPSLACYDDVYCQCQALAHAAYKIDDDDIREMLLYTLLEKQQQLEMLLPASGLGNESPAV